MPGGGARIVWFRNGFYAYWYDERGKPRRTALRTQDRQAAERGLLDFEASRRAKPTTVAEIMTAYLADKPQMASAQRVRDAWKHLSSVFGHLRPDQVDRPICRAYAAKRRREQAQDGTIIKELSSLRAALHWQDKNTSAVIELPPSPPPKSRPLTREEYRTFRDASRKVPHLWGFVVLAYSTAGRASAILELTWDRVDFERGVIRLGLGEKRAKGRATVPMTESARAALVELRRAAVTDYVIEYAGNRVGSVKRAFAAAAERAGVPWCTPHVLRHTAAVHMAESGVSMAEIAQYLGHSSESVTFRTYARFSPTHLRKAASALE